MSATIITEVIPLVIQFAPEILSLIADGQAAIAAGSTPTAQQQAALDTNLAADQVAEQAAAVLAMGEQP